MKTSVAAVAIGSWVALAACGGGSTKADVTQPATTGGESSKAPTTGAAATPKKAKLTWGTPITDVEAALGCIDAKPRPKDSSIGPTPTDDQVCNFNGSPVVVQTWATQGQINQSKAIAKQFASLAGGITVAIGDGWTVTGYHESSSADYFEQDKTVVKAVIKKIGGELFEADA